MKSFRFKVLVSALRAAGVIRDVPALIAVLEPSSVVKECCEVDDLLRWIDGDPVQTIWRVDRERNLRPMGRNTAEVLDFSMFLSPDLRSMDIETFELFMLGRGSYE